MKLFKGLALAICFLAFYSSGKAQDNTGQVYVIRALNYVGSAVNFHIYADDSLVCKLKNKKYSVHTLSAGEHTFAVQNMGLSSHKKSIGLKVNVVPGKINYIIVTDSGSLGLQEVTSASGEQMVKRLVQVKDCLGKK